MILKEMKILINWIDYQRITQKKGDNNISLCFNLITHLFDNLSYLSKILQNEIKRKKKYI